jgi:hypothetical protein
MRFAIGQREVGKVPPVIADPSPVESRSLRSKLTLGLDHLTGNMPPQGRAALRLLLSQLKDYLRTVSEDKLRTILLGIRDAVDDLLEEG